MTNDKHIALYCVGNRLMYDDGIGPAVFDQLQTYEFPSTVDVFDLGCLTLDRIGDVATYDVIICVDALDATGEAPGTIFRFAPEDMAKRSFGEQSLHDLKLSDLFSSAALLGYEASGVCLGMQIAHGASDEVHVGLSPVVEEKIADLVDCVLAELVHLGARVVLRSDNRVVAPGFHHTYIKRDLV